MNDVRAQEWVGQTLAGFRILLELDRGRSSVVFVGQDVQSHAPVAIKIIPPGNYADAAAAAAPAIMALVHPHVARLITFGRHNNHVYLIYEFAAFRQPIHTPNSFDATTLFSKHLAEYVQEQPALLPLSDVIDFLQQLLDALIYAHGVRATGDEIAFGAIHPHHILVQLDAAGRAHLRFSGFGLPRLVSRRAAADAYTSPEELQGQPPSHAADIYALGAIAYLLVIGIAPPAPLVDPSRIRSDAAPAWDAFIRRALSFAPTDRFIDFEDMRRALLALRLTLLSPSLFTRMKTALFVNVIVGLLVVAAVVAGLIYYRKNHPSTVTPMRSDVEIVSDSQPAPELPPLQTDDDLVIVVDDAVSSTASPSHATAPALPLDLSGGVAIAGVAVSNTPPAPPAAAPPATAPTAQSPAPAPTTSAPVPPLTPAPAAPAAVEATIVESYTANPGDTLFSIARAHHVPLSQLLAFNNFTTATVLKAGQKLLLVPHATAAQSAAPALPATPAASAAPATIKHRVQQGETYFSISRKYHCTVEQLQSLNNNQPLRFDTEINVPAPAAAPAPAPASTPAPAPTLAPAATPAP